MGGMYPGFGAGMCDIASERGNVRRENKLREWERRERRGQTTRRESGEGKERKKKKVDTKKARGKSLLFRFRKKAVGRCSGFFGTLRKETRTGGGGEGELIQERRCGVKRRKESYKMGVEEELKKNYQSCFGGKETDVFLSGGGGGGEREVQTEAFRERPVPCRTG